MKIKSKAFVSGKILDKYGKKGSQQRFGMPTLSFPFEIENAPENTKSFAIIFDDPDSEKIYDVVWVHWLVANLTRTKLDENASETDYDFIQGKNTWNENCYGGPCPPDKPHKYRLRAFALSSNLNLTGNFTLKHLEEEMKGKILETTKIYGTYSN